MEGTYLSDTLFSFKPFAYYNNIIIKFPIFKLFTIKKIKKFGNF